MECVSDTEQEDVMAGEFTWFEMGVPDATRAQSFYGPFWGGRSSPWVRAAQ
jgi:hypothetical protein